MSRISTTSLIFCLISALTGNTACSQCNIGDYTVTGTVVIDRSCVISGNLTLLDGATLDVDPRNASADTFVVRGNIVLKGNAVLWVHSAAGSTNDQFVVSNSFSTQRTITTLDSSRVQLENIEFRTLEGDLTNAASLYMNYYSADNSVFYINNSWLDPRTAWLLCNLENRSTLIGYGSNHVPTESYLQDSAQLTVHGATTNMGLWLDLESVAGGLDLPPGQAQPYTWKVGRGAGGLPCFLQNSTGCSENDMVDLTTGVPLCNPFIPAGYPQNLSPASVTFNGVNYGCTGLANDSSLKIFPNPAENLVQIDVPDATESYSMQVFSMTGQLLLSVYNRKSIDISTLANGVYLISVKQKGKTWVKLNKH